MTAPLLPEPAAADLAPRPVRRWRARLFQAYLAGAVVGFALLLVLATSTAYSPLDLAITRGVQSIQAGWFERLMEWVSWPGFSPQAVVLTLVIAAAVFALGLRWEAACALLSAAGAAGLGIVVKALVARPRPSADLVAVFAPLQSYSFPSGHVLYYTTFFGFLLFLAYALPRRSWRRTLLLLALGALVVLVGLSRIDLGQHWFSDVLAAYLLGSLWLTLTIRLYRWGRPRFSPASP